MLTARIWNLVIVGLVLAIFSGNVLGGDKNDRKQRAKAALALAAAANAKGVPVAPSPRPAELLPYDEGSRQALAGQYPIVVYCGFNGPRIADASPARSSDKRASSPARTISTSPTRHFA